MYKYKTIIGIHDHDVGMKQFDDELTKLSSEGFEMVSMGAASGGNMPDVVVIMRKSIAVPQEEK